MHRDRFGMTTATDAPIAIKAFESATHIVAAHRPGAAIALAEAIETSPDFVAAHALLGFANVMLCKSETNATARVCLMTARDAAARSGASSSETALVQSLALAVDGGLSAAADRLEAHLPTHQDEFLVAKLAHSLRFMTGDALGMLTSVDRTLMALPTDHPGYGFTLGCRAFALEELGAFDGAERLGQRAVGIEPDDSWAIHAVGHVHEMTGRAADGLAWIESRRRTWTNCNNFALHMSWHAALLHLELGRVSRALDIFDKEVWPRASDDFRDMSNAVALLSRIEQFGIDVGDRWDGPAAIAASRSTDVTLTFAALHNLLALVASGRNVEARDLAGALNRVSHDADDQESIRASVGRPLANALLGLADGAATPIDFASILRDLPRVGGSNAQRDVFVRSLACMAADRKDGGALENILGVRRKLKRDDSFAALVRARFSASETRLRIA